MKCRKWILALGILAVTTLMGSSVLTGCSADSNILAPVPEENSATESAMTETLLIPGIPCPPGYEIVTGITTIYRPGGALDDDDGACESEEIEAEEGGEVSCDYAGVSFEPGVLQEDAEIEICLPQPGAAFVQFGPHPLEFDGVAEIWFDISDIDDDDIDDLAMWYIESPSEFESVPFTIDEENELVVGLTSHFSRYILTRRCGN